MSKTARASCLWLAGVGLLWGNCFSSLFLIQRFFAVGVVIIPLANLLLDVWGSQNCFRVVQLSLRERKFSFQFKTDN